MTLAYFVHLHIQWEGPVGGFALPSVSPTGWDNGLVFCDLLYILHGLFQPDFTQEGANTLWQTSVGANINPRGSPMLIKQGGGKSTPALSPEINPALCLSYRLVAQRWPLPVNKTTSVLYDSC